jgi:hypothetical protein
MGVPVSSTRMLTLRRVSASSSFDCGETDGHTWHSENVTTDGPMKRHRGRADGIVP